MSYEVYQIKDSKHEKPPFKLLYITHSKYDKGWHSTQHTHHFSELFYIVKGKGSFVLVDQEIPIKENDLVIINPNVEHTEKSNLHDSLEYIALGIEGLFFSSADKRNHLGLYRFQVDRNNILFYLNRLLEEIQLSKENYEIICQNIIEIMIIKLQRDKKLTINQTASPNINKASAFIMYYINQNYRDSITLDKLAEVGHINKYYLAHTFKKDMGISPIEYLNRVRIKEAKLMLETTDYSIAHIAAFTGFSSQSFFTQAFKRLTSQTPSKYRKEMRANS
ncbi:AraC family transcriptional regulator [Virgibacillus pantothenticus]|uniref:AraC family transcriptional regulator n=1 Tax=Virgibacillus pantothenticus TaxID=1473 RepID=A0A0L0QM53_VIRPA|nr:MULTISPECIES: AraC family transcriptional regulator [Virgibacillus]API93319.1 AraC family transcriptional regulator [Virgibacillus sp. 6R]KNE19589.1 AraC family transcriptional regulator [Virgibacillus pantothenticus]MBS7428630.1 helix-turn-helix domain-containing protein [Virgibacillus sp. 19R1-5]MBU8565841.1 AraC family transcriptional regulator [Virgibacillus pantothenticus]MBU8599572.1 AraC family transcriptional regulator [Virgibacillus pantothenticus]